MIRNEDRQWTFPELNEEENEIIVKARNSGYFLFYPVGDQAQNTLKGARKHLGLPEAA